MATSTIPAAITYLLATFRAMPEFAVPVLVSDGWPSGTGDTALVVGITPGDPRTENEILHAELGAQTQWETYNIPCIIWAHRGGGDEVMTAARAAAFTLLNAIDTHLRTAVGRTLGGVLQSGTAILSGVTMSQTGTAVEAGGGRVCSLEFAIRCKSRSSA